MSRPLSDSDVEGAGASEDPLGGMRPNLTALRLSIFAGWMSSHESLRWGPEMRLSCRIREGDCRPHLVALCAEGRFMLGDVVASQPFVSAVVAATDRQGKISTGCSSGTRAGRPGQGRCARDGGKTYARSVFLRFLRGPPSSVSALSLLTAGAEPRMSRCDGNRSPDDEAGFDGVV